jgi:hypothetical protein
VEKPQIGEYFFVEHGSPLMRIEGVFSNKVNAWFVKGSDGCRYLIIFDPNERMWVTVMKITHGNF